MNWYLVFSYAKQDFQIQSKKKQVVQYVPLGIPPSFQSRKVNALKGSKNVISFIMFYGLKPISVNLLFSSPNSSFYYGVLFLKVFYSKNHESVYTMNFRNQAFHKKYKTDIAMTCLYLEWNCLIKNGIRYLK